MYDFVSAFGLQNIVSLYGTSLVLHFCHLLFLCRIEEKETTYACRYVRLLRYIYIFLSFRVLNLRIQYFLYTLHI